MEFLVAEVVRLRMCAAPNSHEFGCGDRCPQIAPVCSKLAPLALLDGRRFQSLFKSNRLAASVKQCQRNNRYLRYRPHCAAAWNRFCRLSAGFRPGAGRTPLIPRRKLQQPPAGIGTTGAFGNGRATVQVGSRGSSARRLQLPSPTARLFLERVCRGLTTPARSASEGCINPKRQRGRHQAPR